MSNFDENGIEQKSSLGRLGFLLGVVGVVWLAFDLSIGWGSAWPWVIVIAGCLVVLAEKVSKISRRHRSGPRNAEIIGGVVVAVPTDGPLRPGGQWSCRLGRFDVVGISGSLTVLRLESVRKLDIHHGHPDLWPRVLISLVMDNGQPVEAWRYPERVASR